MRLTAKPAVASLWPELERLFGPKGACQGCWCMYWRLSRATFDHMSAEARKANLKRLTEEKIPPGLLFYDGNEPVAWCSVAPREAYPSLNRSPLLKPLDATPVWSITCFFVSPENRRQNLQRECIRLAIDYLRTKRVSVVEAYPNRRHPAGYMGSESAFLSNGFTQAGGRKEHRPVLRLTLSTGARGTGP